MEIGACLPAEGRRGLPALAVGAPFFVPSVPWFVVLPWLVWGEGPPCTDSLP